MTMTNPFSGNIPQSCRDRAASLGRQYFWGVRNKAGEIFYEGQSGKLSLLQQPGIAMLKKAATDPWSSICITGATHAVWIPVATDGVAYMVSATNCDYLICMRKQHLTSTGDTYTSYVLGERWEDQVKEEQVHIQPPTRYMFSGGRILTFNGAVSTITRIGEKTEYEKFVEAN
jgi:hypothetical protein